ncbi:MAG: cobyric acid synthase, partial [Lentilitoribacter sp.]
MPAILDSFEQMKAESDLVLVEGAGSPAEVNLRKADLANMGFAHAADLPVMLVGDIHRGGVIASLVGTKAVLDEADNQRIKAFLINNFHGDVSLFDQGIKIVEEATGWFSAGVVPHFAAARNLPAEDALALDNVSNDKGQMKIAVPRLARIANFDDLDPLRLEEGVAVNFVQAGEPIPADADLVLLPGSKSTMSDMAYFKEQGWDIDLKAHVRRGGRVLGLCGGYQMLGKKIHDPDGIEGASGSIDGLGLLDIETILTPKKSLENRVAKHLASGEMMDGFEMHLGESDGPARARPFAEIEGRPEGAVARDGQIAGTYLHGIFSSDDFRKSYLASFGLQTADLSYNSLIDET